METHQNDAIKAPAECPAQTPQKMNPHSMSTCNQTIRGSTILTKLELRGNDCFIHHSLYIVHQSEMIAFSQGLSDEWCIMGLNNSQKSVSMDLYPLISNKKKEITLAAVLLVLICSVLSFPPRDE